MIPIGLPSYEFIFVRLAFFAATMIWIVWTLRLVFNYKARSRLRATRAAVFALLSVISVYSLWSVYALRRDFIAYKAEQTAKYHPVLSENRRLGGIDMPTGTALTLGIALQPEAFNRAEFPHPVMIGGIETLSVERYLRIETDENYHTTGFTSENIRLTGIGTSKQEGWICDSTAVVVFETHTDGSIKDFQSCTAAAGNSIDNIPLPAGSQITTIDGRKYLDGRYSPDRWLIHIPTDSNFLISGTDLKGGSMFLDVNRAIVELVPQ